MCVCGCVFVFVFFTMQKLRYAEFVVKIWKWKMHAAPTPCQNIKGRQCFFYFLFFFFSFTYICVSQSGSVWGFLCIPWCMLHTLKKTKKHCTLNNKEIHKNNVVAVKWTRSSQYCCFSCPSTALIHVLSDDLDTDSIQNHVVRFFLSAVWPHDPITPGCPPPR